MLEKRDCKARLPWRTRAQRCAPAIPGALFLEYLRFALLRLPLAVNYGGTHTPEPEHTMADWCKGSSSPNTPRHATTTGKKPPLSGSGYPGYTTGAVRVCVSAE